MISDPTGTEWIVLLEAAGADTAPPRSTADDLRKLLNAWGSPPPATLHGPDRYALQLQVHAVDQTTALSMAIEQWRDAVACSGLPEWELVRVEIMTPEELEREHQAADRSDEPLSSRWSRAEPTSLMADEFSSGVEGPGTLSE